MASPEKTIIDLGIFSRYIWSSLIQFGILLESNVEIGAETLLLPRTILYILLLILLARPCHQCYPTLLDLIETVIFQE